MCRILRGSSIAEAAGVEAGFDGRRSRIEIEDRDDR
jgi:hypothetical protein